MGFAQDIAGMFGGSSGFGSGDPDSTSNSENTSKGFSQAGIGAGFGLAGLALGAFGAAEGVKAAKASAESGKAIAGLEQKVNDQRQLAMQITARRQQMETVRKNQQAQSQARAAAANQGASFGSGLAGGLAGISGQSASNLSGTNQQLDIGNQIFGLDRSISQEKIKQYQAQSDQASASGISSFGGALLKAAPMLASLAAV